MIGENDRVRLLRLDYPVESVVRGQILTYRDLEFTCRPF
jgi:hypothetical protein